MVTYAIGDVQGCYTELIQLLDLVNFNKQRDTLWFLGDLVNRGPKSLETLRFIKDLPNKRVVLGNHDMFLIALASGTFKENITHTLHNVIEAPDCNVLIDWLKQQPLFFYDKKLQHAIVHAGIIPQWNILQAEQYADEVHQTLYSKSANTFLSQMYGDKPDTWSEELTGMDRLRFITNVFTRIRICDKNGKMELTFKKHHELIPEGYLPWFNAPNRVTKSNTILFGHWAALQGKTNTDNVIALDTGCAWGGTLTAYCVDDGKYFSVPASKSDK